MKHWFIFLYTIVSLGMSVLPLSTWAVGYQQTTSSSSMGPVHSIQANILREQTSVSPGQSFWLAAEITLPAYVRTGWFLPLGDWPATHVQLRLPKTLAVRQILWPIPKVDLSSAQPQVYYEDQVTVLIEVMWRPASYGKPIEKSLMDGQLLVDGQARWSGQSQLYAFNRLAILPALRLPNEVPYPQDPLAISTFQRARQQVPDHLDQAQVDWVSSREGVQIHIQGMMLNHTRKWFAVAYRIRSDIIDPMSTVVVPLSYMHSGEKDTFIVPRRDFNQWLNAGVEEVLLIDESGSQAWVVTLEQEVGASSFVKQVSNWCHDFIQQISEHFRT